MAVGLAGAYIALMTPLSGAFAAEAIPSALYICCALFSLMKVTTPMVIIAVGCPYLQGRIAVPAAAWGFAKSHTLLINFLDALVCAHATELSVDSMHVRLKSTRMAAHVSSQSTSVFPCIPPARFSRMCYMCPRATGRKAYNLHDVCTQCIHTLAGLGTASHTICV